MTEVSVDEYGPLADLYDYVVPYRNRTDVGFFVDEAVRSKGPVLEVGCGTGRVLIPIARAGVEIVGLDSSPRMMEECSRRLSAEPSSVQQKVTLVPGDMRHFDLSLSRRSADGAKADTFPLITIPFRPFQHLLTTEEQLSCLECVRRHLADEGRFIFDLFNPSLDALVTQPLGEETDPQEGEFTTPDGRRVLRKFVIVAADRFAQINDIELLYYVTHPDGRTERLVHAFRMRYLFRFEAEHLLARAGFTVEHLYAGFDRSAYGSIYPGELVFVARKAV